MVTFALVHGAWHGAWCWERLTPLLFRAGHNVVAMDLPIDDVTATFETHADVVCDALSGCQGEVVAVGHSFGGMVIPLVAARRAMRHLVFVCALVPAVGRSLNDLLRDEPGTFNTAATAGYRRDAQGRNVWVDADLAHTFMYADCDQTTSRRAIERLRPHSPAPNSSVFSLAEFPKIHCTSVICTDDQLFGPERAKWVAERRLAADIVELPGSHSPFLSRPETLAEVLLRIAAH
jgi:pimeloyl-ACP methyl ester carboxylesterase